MCITDSGIMGSGPSAYAQEKDVSKLNPSELGELLRRNDFLFISQKFQEFGECFYSICTKKKKNRAITCRCSK